VTNLKQVKPPFIDDAEWSAIKKAKSLLTEHFENIGIFINWVSPDGETRYYHVLDGNKFAMENHITKWTDNDFDEPETSSSDQDDDDDDDDDASFGKNKKK
jgi:hypothetical protein